MGFPTLQLILCEFSVILRPSEISCFSLTWPTIGPAIPVLKGCCVHLVELPIPAAGTKTCFFPTCLARVVRFYVSRPPSPPPPDLNYLNCKLVIAVVPIRVVPAGPQLQARDRSGPCRTRTASPGSEWSMPDPNCKRETAVVPAGPQLQVLDRSVPHLTRTATAGWKWP